MIKNLDPAEKKTLFAWLIIGIVILLILVIVRVINPNIFFKNKVDYSKNSYQILKDYNRYYTVLGAINKYYSFINAESYESVIHILDKTYVEDNKIDEKNVLNFISQSDKALSYKGSIMCYKELDSGITSYITSGKETMMNSLDDNKDVFYEVILDSNHFTFSIKPIDAQSYGGYCHG